MNAEPRSVMAEEALRLGLVLCRVAEFRFAFPADQVATIELSSNRRSPSARAAWQLPAAPGKILVAETGDSVSVDALEVYSETVPLLPPPAIMLADAGGALRGFAEIKGELWPVLRLAEFSRFLLGLADG